MPFHASRQDAESIGARDGTEAVPYSRKKTERRREQHNFPPSGASRHDRRRPCQRLSPRAGIRLDPRAKLVAACDTDAELLEQRRGEWGIDKSTTDIAAICADPDVDAVIIATPNFTHRVDRCGGRSRPAST